MAILNVFQIVVFVLIPKRCQSSCFGCFKPMAWRKILLPLGLSGLIFMKFFVLIASLCLVAPAASAQDVYQEFMDTLKEQNQKGCDTSYVGGYVSLYQALTLLCDLRKDNAITAENFNRYASDVINVLGSSDASNIQAALEYATETCGKKNVSLPLGNR